ncbi:hypothetical protein BDD12DRAFT_690880, partial [Trichophaea hybrida]
TSSTAHPSDPNPQPSMSEPLAQQNEYYELQQRVALGVLIVAPILIALPPRKIDPYTFGLGVAWVFCLNEVTKYRGTTLLGSLRNRKTQSVGEIKAEADNGWKGESVFGQYREREEEGKGIGEMIMVSCWDVWQQRDK